MTATYLSLAAITLTVIGLLLQRFVFDTKIENRITSLETKVDLWWRMVEKNLADIIHSPHTPDIDRLLEKLEFGLTFEETSELICRLEAQLKEEKAKSPKDSGRLIALIMIINQLKMKTYTEFVKVPKKIR